MIGLYLFKAQSLDFGLLLSCMGHVPSPDVNYLLREWDKSAAISNPTGFSPLHLEKHIFLSKQHDL